MFLVGFPKPPSVIDYRGAAERLVERFAGRILYDDYYAAARAKPMMYGPRKDLRVPQAVIEQRMSLLNRLSEEWGVAVQVELRLGDGVRVLTLIGAWCVDMRAKTDDEAAFDSICKELEDFGAAGFLTSEDYSELLIEWDNRYGRARASL